MPPAALELSAQYPDSQDTQVLHLPMSQQQAALTWAAMRNLVRTLKPSHLVSMRLALQLRRPNPGTQTGAAMANHDATVRTQ
jgi:hypothetical protein